MNPVIAITTTDKMELAQQIADTLVTRRLAACVNIIPKVISVYRWEQKLHSDQECMLLIKTDPRHEEALRETIENLHNYDCPELIILPIVGGSKHYLSWIQQQIGHPG